MSIFAEKADELVAALRRAEKVADVIELRFDGLDYENIRIAFEQLSSEKQILLTMRPKSQGGRSERNLVDRVGFWMEYALHKMIDHSSIWIDHEHDLISQKDFMFWVDQCFVIRSRHYLEGETGTDLDKAYEAVVSNAEVGKIAVTTHDAADAIGVWQLLVRANEDGLRTIPIAMGEAGKWTRILGLAHGAFMTYAALETGTETAPGQLTADDLIDVFRVRELDKETAVYGVIAGNTSYSASPWMHNAAFKAAGLNAVFVPFQVTDLDRFMKKIVLSDTREIELNLHGFSVTNPHKQAVIEYLDEVDETAARIGAVNTVKVQDGKLYGHNTDADAFIATLKAEYGDLEDARVAVFGAGGAARACIAALLNERASVGLFARNDEKGAALAEEFEIAFEGKAGDRQIGDDFDIVVNATPLGTVGTNIDFTPLTGPQLNGLGLVYDLVYNPAETLLMREAKAVDVPAIGGVGMLIAQGAKQFGLWTGREAPLNEMSAALNDRLKSQ
ncbi:MAG: shikimate dehydrogenase [Pyrinomonadaceae bacterium]